MLPGIWFNSIREVRSENPDVGHLSSLGVAGKWAPFISHVSVVDCVVFFCIVSARNLEGNPL